MNALLTRFTHSPLLAIEVMTASFFISLLNLAMPVFVIQLLNRFVSHGFSGTLYTLTAGVVIAIILQYCFQLVRTALLSQMNEEPDKILEQDVLHTLSTVRFGAIARLSRDQIGAIMSDIRKVQAGWEPLNIIPLIDIPFVILYLLALSFLSPVLAFIALIGTFLGLALGAYSFAADNKIAEQLAQMFVRYRKHEFAALNAPETIRAFNAAGYLDTIRQNSLNLLSTHRQRLAFSREQSSSLMMTIGSLQSVIMYSVGAILVVQGELSVGVLIGANILASRSFQSIARLFRSIHLLKEATKSRKVLDELRQLPREQNEGVAIRKFSGQLRLQNVGFGYAGGTGPLFESLSLSLSQGDILTVTGNNGTGKTTLIRLIAGLLECGRGEILANNVNLKQIARPWWRKQLIYLPQEPTFFLASIMNNIILGEKADDVLLNRVVQEAGLREYLDRSLAGVEAIVNDPATLPTGIRKRIALARALTTNGPLILFDEPTDGLDLDGCGTIYTLLNKCTQARKTIIVSSNDPQIIKASNVLIDLNHKPVPKVTRSNGGK